MPFGWKGEVRRCVVDKYMENDSWKVACVGVHHVKYHLGISAHTERASHLSSQRQVCNRAASLQDHSSEPGKVAERSTLCPAGPSFLDRNQWLSSLKTGLWPLKQGCPNFLKTHLGKLVSQSCWFGQV